jgi:hypothetical protein
MTCGERAGRKVGQGPPYGRDSDDNFADGADSDEKAGRVAKTAGAAAERYGTPIKSEAGTSRLPRAAPDCIIARGASPSLRGIDRASGDAPARGSQLLRFAGVRSRRRVGLDPPYYTDSLN